MRDSLEDAKSAALSTANICRMWLASALIDWVEARVLINFWDTRDDCFVALYRDRNGVEASFALGQSVWAPARDLRATVEAAEQMPIARLRVMIGEDWVNFDHCPDPCEGSPGWLWPDETGFKPPASQHVDAIHRAISKVEDFRYRPYSGTRGAPESLALIVDWLAQHSDELADSFNPSTTASSIAAAEESLGVVFPKSLREAYLARNGTRPNSNSLLYEWKPVEALEELASGQFFSHRADATELIPFMETDDGLFFTESVADPEDDRPVWAWREGARNEDSKIADSFGAFLAHLADGLTDDSVIIDPESKRGLIYWDEFFGNHSMEEAKARSPQYFE